MTVHRVMLVPGGAFIISVLLTGLYSPGDLLRISSPVTEQLTSTWTWRVLIQSALCGRRRPCWSLGVSSEEEERDWGGRSVAREPSHQMFLGKQTQPLWSSIVIVINQCDRNPSVWPQILNQCDRNQSVRSQ